MYLTEKNSVQVVTHGSLFNAPSSFKKKCASCIVFKLPPIRSQVIPSLFRNQAVSMAIVLAIVGFSTGHKVIDVLINAFIGIMNANILQGASVACVTLGLHLGSLSSCSQVHVLATCSS
jgi:hypothetical protein